MDVPGTVDYVVGLVPAQASLGLIAECAAKGVRVIHFCTAGFSETGDEERSRLEIDLADLARKHRIRIIGPNCLGAYCPESRLTFGPIFPKESGPVGLISQSGGNANYTIRQAAMRGVRFSKVMDGSDFPVESSAKPVVAVIEPSIVPEEATVLYDLLQRYVTSGLPVYYSFAGAASAIDKVMRHYEHQSRPGLGHSNSLTSRRSGH